MIHSAILYIVHRLAIACGLGDVVILLCCWLLYLYRCHAYNHLAGLLHLLNKALIRNLWNPNAKLDSNGNFKAEFYNGSREVRMKVSAEGLTTEGKTIINQ